MIEAVASLQYSYCPGDIVDLEEEKAAAWIANGVARELTDADNPHTMETTEGRGAPQTTGRRGGRRS